MLTKEEIRRLDSLPKGIPKPMFHRCPSCDSYKLAWSLDNMVAVCAHCGIRSTR